MDAKHIALGPVRGGTAVLAALSAHNRGYPFATNLSLISVPIGLLALIIGPEISRGFVAVYGGQPGVIYGWGAVLLLGGINVALGIGHRRPSRERAGLYVLALAYAFYGVSVIAGLGWGGLVTGPVFCILAVSCGQRAHNILESARALAVVTQQVVGGGPGD